MTLNALPTHELCRLCGAWLKRDSRGVYRHRPGYGARCIAALSGRSSRYSNSPSQPCLYCGLPTDGLGELCLSCGLQRESELESMS